jgi:proteasome lid subunit RPN8/RPN11
MTLIRIPKRRRRSRSDRRTLTFSARAWLKFQYLCHAGPTEVGGFGLSHPDDPLYVEDILVVRQTCSFVTVAFDDTAVADLFEAMADAGIPPARFARIWLHTHPGASVEPSLTDEETFARVFGTCDWSVMAILGRTGRMSARLQFTRGPGAAVALSTRVDWSEWPDIADTLAERAQDWRQAYDAQVQVEPRHDEQARTPALLDPFDIFPTGDWHALG